MADSKYFKKHYEVLEPEYDEVQCWGCGYVFMVDFRWTSYELASDGKRSASVVCPYCARKRLIRI